MFDKNGDAGIQKLWWTAHRRTAVPHAKLPCAAGAVGVSESFPTAITKTVPASAPISAVNAANYTWGAESNPCDGWHLVRTPGLSVILERMPPGTSEVRHYHERARQFFFVLEGELTVEIADEKFVLEPQQGIEVAPTTQHQVFNRSSQDVRFLVISQPPSHGDRVKAVASDE